MSSPAWVARVAPTRKPTLPGLLPVEPTAAQRTRAWELAPVLRAIRAGEVWQEPDGRSVETHAEYFGTSDPIADVTEEVALAEAAGLAVVRPFRTAAGGWWELTRVGATALAELDAKESHCG